MNDMGLIISVVAAIIWVIILLLPWQPWRTKEVLEPDSNNSVTSLDDVTVVIPARNEAQVIATTLRALPVQGAGLKVILVDDESSDATTAIAGQSDIDNLTLSVPNKPDRIILALSHQSQILQLNLNSTF